MLSEADSPSSIPLRLLRIVAALLFLGQAWVHLDLKMPLSAVAWDEAMMSGVLKSIWGIEWSAWASDLRVEQGMDAVSRAFGVFYLLCAVVSLIPTCARWRGLLLGLSGVSLLFLAYLKFREADKGIGNFLEHAGQFCTPWILWWAEKGAARSWTLGWMRGALILTFVFHGLFAFGLPAESAFWDHATPVQFVEMTMMSLGMESESAARTVLQSAGVLDWLAAVLILLPLRSAGARSALLYMVVWGALTSLARPWAHVQTQDLLPSLNVWLPELILRSPHWGLPLLLLWMAFQKKELRRRGS